MTSDYSTTADAVALDAARTSLDHLMAWVGVDGMVAAMRSPGLLAAVDQHAAEVRDLLGDRVHHAPALAAHARTVHQAATLLGHTLPDPARLDWASAPAYLVHLVAVCALAGTAGCL
jgi:hypothetical protein